ncbi:MAG: SPFH domain-containing protein [Desulfobacteraceae bacterium]|jgi:regulator of protease activity HflC (stomatin/prohibitin superfamily)
MRNVWTIVLLCAVTVLVGCSNPFTPAGHEGYVYESPRVYGKGGFKGVIKGPGNFGASLWRNKVINIDFRPSTYIENFNILAKDDLNVSFKFEAVIKVSSGKVEKVVQDYAGKQWYPRFVKEPFRSFVRNSTQKYTSRELKSQREVISEEVKVKLENYLTGSPFELVKLVVGNIDYPPVVAKAVEKKLAAHQLLEEKETQKAIAKRDAEIKIEEAKGIAEAQRIINSTLTANYLQHEAIQAQLAMSQSPNHTTVYIPSGANGIPLIKTMK